MSTFNDRNLLKFYVLSIVDGITKGIWNFVPIFLIDLGGTTLDVGLLSTIPGLASTFMQLSWGRVYDQYGQNKRLWVTGYILMGLLTIPIIHLQIPWQVILFNGLRAFFTSVIDISRTIYLGEAVHPSIRARFMSVYDSINFIGFTAGTFFAGLLIPVYGYFLPFYFFVFLNIFCGIIINFSVREASSTKNLPKLTLMLKASFAGAFEEFNQLPILFREGGKYASYCVGVAVRGFGIAVSGPVLTVYLYRYLGASKPEIAFLTALSSGIRVGVTPLLGLVADKKGRKRIFLTGVLLATFYPLVYVNASNVSQLYPVYVMHGFFWSCIEAAWFAWQMDLLPPRRGMFMGLLNFLNGMAWALGPVVGGFLGQYLGVWWTVIVAAGVTGLGFMQLFRIPERIDFLKND